jgi:hypothetical protein
VTEGFSAEQGLDVAAEVARSAVPPGYVGGTEETGFAPEPEPVFDAAPFAEMELLREGLYAVQNTVVRLENERRGKVLVDVGDLRQVLTLAARDPASWSDAERGAYNRTFDAAEEAGAAVGAAEAGSAGAGKMALSDAAGTGGAA